MAPLLSVERCYHFDFFDFGAADGTLSDRLPTGQAFVVFVHCNATAQCRDDACGLLPDDLALEGGTLFTHSDSIEVKRVKGKGRGVFARRLIRKGELIEKVPMLVLPVEQSKEGSVIWNYCFAWKDGTAALALGYGSIYNHSYRPNARYEDLWPQTKEFTALRDIEPGEEITVNYNGEPRSRAKVWFEVIEATRPRTNGASDGGVDLNQPT
jgi:hypothetical protein